MKIEELRLRIETTDCQILELIKKRAELAEEIGWVKKQQGCEIRNPEVERTVKARYSKFASENGLDSEILESIAGLLIEESVRKEETVSL